jgi:hypothetical protein
MFGVYENGPMKFLCSWISTINASARHTTRLPIGTLEQLTILLKKSGGPYS